MKNSEAGFEEWCEIVEEYFTNELEKNMAQHRAYEKIMRYKLEAYQKKILDFICGSPTSTEVLGQDEETKTRPNGTTQEEKLQTKEPQDFINGITQEEVQSKKPHDLRGGGQKEKNHREFRNKKNGSYSNTKKKSIQNITSKNRTTY